MTEMVIMTSALSAAQCGNLLNFVKGLSFWLVRMRDGREGYYYHRK